MYDDQEILEQIKKIECPTDAVMDRVIGVLEDYRPSGGYQMTVDDDDDDEYINDDMKVYRAYSESPGAPSIVVTVREGSDHYVASVIDAYIENGKDSDRDNAGEDNGANYH